MPTNDQTSKLMDLIQSGTSSVNVDPNVVQTSSPGMRQNVEQLTGMLNTGAEIATQTIQYQKELHAEQVNLQALMQSAVKDRQVYARARWEESKTNTESERAIISEVDQRTAEIDKQRLELAKSMEGEGLIGRIFGAMEDRQLEYKRGKYAEIGLSAIARKQRIISESDAALREYDATVFADRRMAIAQQKQRMQERFNPEGVAKAQALYKEQFDRVIQVTDRLSQAERDARVARETEKAQAGIDVLVDAAIRLNPSLQGDRKDRALMEGVIKKLQASDPDSFSALQDVALTFRTNPEMDDSDFINALPQANLQTAKMFAMITGDSQMRAYLDNFHGAAAQYEMRIKSQEILSGLVAQNADKIETEKLKSGGKSPTEERLFQQAQEMAKEVVAQTMNGWTLDYINEYARDRIQTADEARVPADLTNHFRETGTLQTIFRQLSTSKRGGHKRIMDALNTEGGQVMNQFVNELQTAAAENRSASVVATNNGIEFLMKLKGINEADAVDFMADFWNEFGQQELASKFGPYLEILQYYDKEPRVQFVTSAREFGDVPGFLQSFFSEQKVKDHEITLTDRNDIWQLRKILRSQENADTRRRVNSETAAQNASTLNLDSL